MVTLCAPAYSPAQPPDAAPNFVPPTSAPRRSIVVGLPTARETASGQLHMAPNVTTQPGDPFPRYRPRAFPAADDPPGAATSPVSTASALQPALPMPLETEMLPAPETIVSPDMNFVPGEATPVFSDLVNQGVPPPSRGLRNWLIARNIEPGVGRERLAHAPFEIDSSAPLANLRFRLNSFSSAPFPDRAEYLWARIGARGPRVPETSVDYEEFRTQLELGTKKFSTATEFPIRWTNPEVNANHAGFGDMRLAIKTVLIDGDTWQITQLFRTYFPTGSPSMGLGTGHVSMEPGFLLRRKWSDVTYLHGELKYFFPIGGDPMFSGQVLNYGLGASHVLIDRDQYAWLTTLEWTGAYIGNGLRTNPNGTVANAEGEHIFNLFPGIRYVRDCGTELGLFEAGLCTGFPLTSPEFYDFLVRFDLRWSF